MLDSLFIQGSWEILHHREWRAYPVLKPKEVGGAPSRGGGGGNAVGESRLDSITLVSLVSSGGPWYKSQNRGGGGGCPPLRCLFHAGQQLNAAVVGQWVP